MALLQSHSENTDEHARDTALARLRSIIAPQAGMWMIAIPSADKPENRLTDSQYQLSARHLLGLDPLDRMPTACACASNTARDHGADLSKNPWHYFDCSQLRRRSINTRHDSIAHVVARWANRAGLVSVLEPYYLFQHQGLKRCDVQLVGHGSNIIMDVTVVDPTSPTHVSSSSKSTLHTAMKTEQRKIVKYGEDAKRHGLTLYPFAVETYGGWGPSANKLLQHIHAMAASIPEHTRCWSSKEIRSGLAEAVSVAVQRGNAMVIQQGIARTTPSVPTRVFNPARTPSHSHTHTHSTSHSHTPSFTDTHSHTRVVSL
jgi:hypothetical protein